MIYILEGPDGVGKTTLARAIADKTKGHILHSSFKSEWNIENYHRNIMEAAIKLNIYQDVIIDRWAVSEFVYGTVFRNGPSYNTDVLIEEYESSNIKWIYCKNDNAIENHLKNKEQRIEMFEDMSEIVKVYDDYINYTSSNWLHLKWITYDYNKNNLDEFVKELT